MQESAILRRGRSNPDSNHNVSRITNKNNLCLLVIHPTPNISPKFVNHFLSYPANRQQIKQPDKQTDKIAIKTRDA